MMNRVMQLSVNKLNEVFNVEPFVIGWHYGSQIKSYLILMVLKDSKALKRSSFSSETRTITYMSMASHFSNGDTSKNNLRSKVLRKILEIFSSERFKILS